MQTQTPSPSRRRRRSSTAATAALAVGLIVAGCGVAVSPSAQPSPSAAPSSDAPSGAPSPDASAPSSADIEQIYAEIEAQVQALRGLEATSDVSPTLLDQAGLTDYAKRSFAADNPPDYVAAYERFYRAMGQLKPDEDLERSFVDLISSGVLGIYDPDTKELYVVARSGEIGATQRVTYAHEFDHAIQDQHFDSKRLLLDSTLDQSDRVVARLALLEGDAYVLMTQWAQRHLTPAQLQEYLADSLDPGALSAMEKVPAVVRDALEFPATAGLVFVLDAFQRGGWEAVDGLYRDPPESTEQILHADKYAAGEDPIAVDLPADLAARMGPGWTESLQDTYGEFGLRQWLRGATRASQPADDAAGGWGGDRIVLLDGPAGAYAGAVVTEWDSTADADEFATQAALAAGNLPGRTSVVRPSDSRVVVLLASDDDGLGRIGSALGVTR